MPQLIATRSPLTEMQKRFVKAYVSLGGRHGAQKEAAIAAGYSPKSSGPAAYQLLHNPAVLEAIKEEVETNIRASLALGFDVLVELAHNGPPAQRFQAAIELLNRGGLLQQKVDRVEHTHRHVYVPPEELRATAINELLKQGYNREDAEKLVRAISGAEPRQGQIMDLTAVDAEFSEVPEDLDELLG